MNEEMTQEDPYHRAGFRLGRFFGGNPLMRPLGYIFIQLIRGLAASVRLPFERHAYRVFRQQCGTDDKSIYFAYSEPHQLERFFGNEGTLTHLAKDTLIDNWRESWKEWKTNRESERGTPFERVCLRYWQISNMRRDLPFLVFFRGKSPTPFFLADAYKTRQKDQGAALKELDRAIDRFAQQV